MQNRQLLIRQQILDLLGVGKPVVIVHALLHGFDVRGESDFSTCHYYASFVLQDLKSSLMSTACFPTFISDKPNAFRIDFCVAVTA